VNPNEPEPDSRAHAPERVAVDLGARSYDILVGGGLLDEAGRHVRPLLALKRTVLITDANVAPLYAERVARSLAAEGVVCETIVLAPGEGAKSFTMLEELLERLLESGAERGMTLIALGGGVIGDLVGFTASVLLRGIDFIQIPTTLLAQIDSSVGGKTGINSRHGKNLIGSFHQPRLVLTDTETLDSLPGRELAAGYAEMVKYGLIDDADFFAWLEDHGAKLLAGDAAARRHAIAHCCRAKARIVAEDEREGGRRALLNLGHTFGHALEAECGFGETLLHGEAVALGTVLAFDLSRRLGLCDAGEAERVVKHLTTLGLPVSATALPARARRRDALLDHMSRDKKVTDGRLRLVLVRGIGAAFLTDEASRDEIAATLDAFLDVESGAS
jgi:3-dehydroquinate synthase